MTQLEQLGLWKNQIADLTGLENCTNLTELYLDDNNISDISSLSGLIQLEKLGLGRNQITDVSALTNLTSLSELDLSRNQITNILSLSGLTQLQKLSFGGNQITDVSALTNLTSLSELYLWGNPITNISPLSGLTQLQKLNLWRNQVDSAAALSGLVELRQLSLSYNRISDISPLTGLTNLEDLWLYQMPLNLDAYNTHIPQLVGQGTAVSYDSIRDNFADRMTISSSGGGFFSNNTNATMENDEPNSFNKDTANIHSLWWRWVAPNDGVVQVTTEGSDFDTVLAVYTGADLANLVLVESNDDASGMGDKSLVQFNAISGTEYAILVDGGGVSTGAVTVGLKTGNFSPRQDLKELKLAVGSEKVITNEILATDVESGAVDLVFTLTRLPQNGQFKRDGVVLAVGDTFTQKDIDDGLIKFVHTANTADGGTYDIRVTDGDGNQSGEVTVNISPEAPANTAPTGLALSVATVTENQASGTEVGMLSTTDADTGDSHTYTLVSGAGYTDNASFTVDGDSLKTASSFDYETQASYSILVQTDDGYGGTFQQTFTITVTDDTSDNPQVVTYGWEDTGVYLGKSGNLKSAVNVGAENGVTPHEGSKMLKLIGAAVSGNAPEAYLAWITGLAEGDQVTVSYWVQGLNADGSKPAGRIWGGYTSSSQVSSESQGTASGSNSYGGDDAVWEQLSKTWTISTGNVALNVKVRVYDDLAGNETIYVDDMQITVSNPNATINLPQPDTTVPVITLNGGASITVQHGVSFDDPGATADDSHEGDISANIAVTGDTVNVSTAGTYTLKYNVSDTAGNAAVEVVRTVVVAAPVDTTPPGAPSVSFTSPTTDTTPQFSGTAEAGSDVTILVDGSALGQATADGSGNYTFTPGTVFADGTYTITATAADSAGNSSAASDSLSLVVDTGAPGAPTLIGTTPTNDNTPALSGTAEANATVTAYSGGTALGQGQADGDGNFSIQLSNALTEGSHDITATATDAANNVSGPSAAHTVVVDTTAPAKPTISVTSPTTDDTPDISGTAEVGATVTVLIDGTVLGPVVAGSNGDFTVTSGALTVGTHSVTARATDAAGNVSADADAVSLVVEASTGSGTLGTTITLYPYVPMTILAKLEHNSYMPVAGDTVKAYVGNELRAKGTVQMEAGVPVVALLVSVNAAATDGAAVAATYYVVGDVLPEGKAVGDVKTAAVPEGIIAESLSDIVVETAADGTQHHFVNKTKLASGTMIGDNGRYLLTDGVTQTLEFKQGWNFVSMYVRKGSDDTMTPSAYFDSNHSKLDEIRTYNGVYNPANPLNGVLSTLTQIELGAGYWVRTSNSFNHTVNGFLGNDLKVSLEAGWNMAGYPRRDRRTVADAIGTLQSAGKLVQMVSDTDLFLADSSLSHFNTLSHFDPGKGYWIKMNDSATWDLNFPEATGSAQGNGRGLAKADGGLKLEQLKRKLVTYPSVPAIVLAELVSAVEIPSGSLVGAFVDDELRGVQVAKRVNGGGTVTLVVHATQREMVSFKLWNRTAQAWQPIRESLSLDSGDLLGSAAERVRLTLEAKPLAKGLVLSRDSMRLVIAPELMGTHKVQRSTDLVHWEDCPVNGAEGETGLTIDPSQSHEFYRLIKR